MFLEIPFHYDAVGTTPHGNVVKDLKLSDSVPVEIREVDPENLFLAARYTDPDPKVTAVTDIFAYENRFWRSFSVSDQGAGRPMRAAELAGAVERGQNSPFSGGQRKYSDDAPRGRGYRGRITESELGSAVRKLNGIARLTVVVAGDVYTDSGLPCYTLAGDWVVMATLAKDDALARSYNLIDAVQLDDFVARNPDLAPLRRMGGIEVIRPDLVQVPAADDLDSAAEGLRSAAMRVEGVLGRRLTQGSREDFDLFATLRDSIAACPRGEITEELSEAISRASEVRISEYGPVFQMKTALDCWSRQMSDAAERVITYGR